MILKKLTTRGKRKTCIVDIHPGFAQILAGKLQANAECYVSRDTSNTEHLTRFMADKILPSAYKRIGFRDVRTHSFRRATFLR
ncbi:hypothetical protein [Nostoc sp. UHCC 0251]|uniref:hypothetical protein n=1 Tax=Nostoc sp. UHCC 0251 TaxID=3110240 RepID=UPI002B1FE6C7|nr:hypothetical protein [Nostoc sp. UHCC 0251]MEA5625164.1 hypothetical protein [Nostoc sp. UHCC 0251]